MVSEINGLTYGKVLESLGKEALSLIFSEMTKWHYEDYKDYLANDRHIDIGAGDGKTALHIRTNNPSLEVQMIDLYDDSLADEVRARLASDVLFKHRVYQVESPLPFPDGYFKSVSLFYVIHHCSERNQTLRLLSEVKRVSSDNANIIVLEEVVRRKDDFNLLNQMDITISKMFFPSLFAKNSALYKAHFYEVAELDGVFRDAGFKVVKSIKPKGEQCLFPRILYILNKRLENDR